MKYIVVFAVFLALIFVMISRNPNMVSLSDIKSKIADYPPAGRPQEEIERDALQMHNLRTVARYLKDADISGSIETVRVPSPLQVKIILRKNAPKEKASLTRVYCSIATRNADNLDFPAGPIMVQVGYKDRVKVMKESLCLLPVPSS